MQIDNLFSSHTTPRGLNDKGHSAKPSDCKTEKSIIKDMHTYEIHLQKEPEGGFTVFVPTLPGCITYGRNMDEAIKMAQEAIELYLGELNKKSTKILIKICKNY